MKQVRELLKEDEPDSCLTDKIIKTKQITKVNPHEDLFNFDWIHDEDAKECFKLIKEDIDKEKYGSHDSRAGLISVTVVKGIINVRAGPKLI